MAVELFEFALTNNKLQLGDLPHYQVEDKALNFIVSTYETITDHDDRSKEMRKKAITII
ncbi:hypothetical protein [Fulvivirga ligni]|uniref:hypothetical protein n=1 Tax=Fulvivirga ligni TaxID=2904246 RepID=UPI001F40C7F3|nr:hypothetical protein [Fulvivirga ligni]UII21587.1 hypothetical protein LVD16_27545 [Fulvivirga ligni]